MVTSGSFKLMIGAGKAEPWFGRGDARLVRGVGPTSFRKCA